MRHKNEIRSNQKLLALFMEYVQPEPNTGCWLWNGDYNSVHGYGRFKKRELPFCRAHRVSYYLHFGEFDYNLCVCHKCDVKLCVNPSHLFLGTSQDNNADKMAKGRNKIMHGSKHGMHILTEKEVLEIRNLKGKVRTRDLAKMFLVSEPTISMILHNKTWKHIA